jgi:hypothetical protein
MQSKLKFSHSPTDGTQYILGLLFTDAVTNPVIGIPFKRDGGKLALYPFIKHIVQKEKCYLSNHFFFYANGIIAGRHNIWDYDRPQNFPAVISFFLTWINPLSEFAFIPF